MVILSLLICTGCISSPSLADSMCASPMTSQTQDEIEYDGRPGALEDGGVAAPAPAPVFPNLGPSLAAPIGFEIDVQHAAGPMCRVRFDNASHSSKVQRAYISCPWPHHHACFKYRQVNIEPDRNRLVAWLYQWAILGESVDKDGHRDETVPVDADVDALQTALYG